MNAVHRYCSTGQKKPGVQAADNARAARRGYNSRCEKTECLLSATMRHNGCCNSSEATNKMAGTYKLVELVGTSPTSFAEATKAAIAEASKTIRHMDWFEVIRESGRIANGQVQEFQVTLKVGFKIER